MARLTREQRAALEDGIDRGPGRWSPTREVEQLRSLGLVGRHPSGALYVTDAGQRAASEETTR